MTLARVSLPLGSVLVLSGCFDAPPEYVVADRLPPVIDSRGVTPSLTRINTVESTQSGVDFVVPFRSDDAGEDLTANFVQDIPQQVDPLSPTCQTCNTLDQVRVAADSRPFAEQTSRQVSKFIPFSPVKPDGCTTVTVILSHTSNFIRGWQMADTADSAQVTWTFQFPGPNGTSGGCSAATGTTP